MYHKIHTEESHILFTRCRHICICLGFPAVSRTFVLSQAARPKGLIKAELAAPFQYLFSIQAVSCTNFSEVNRVGVSKQIILHSKVKKPA